MGHNASVRPRPLAKGRSRDTTAAPMKRLNACMLLSFGAVFATLLGGVSTLGAENKQNVVISTNGAALEVTVSGRKSFTYHAA